MTPRNRDTPIDTAVLRTGTANIASVVAGLRRLGAEPVVTSDADAVRTARRVVLPGVGAFGAVAQSLWDSGLAPALVERIEAGRPTLAVCLGMQLLFESSEEGEGRGLGVASGRVRAFDDPALRSPQMGWNAVTIDSDCRLLTTGYAYFANSYRVTTAPPGWASAMSDYAGPFVAAIERGAVLACQFHPELSGAWGRALLQRWFSTADTPADAAAC